MLSAIHCSSETVDHKCSLLPLPDPLPSPPAPDPLQAAEGPTVAAVALEARAGPGATAGAQPQKVYCMERIWTTQPATSATHFCKCSACFQKVRQKRKTNTDQMQFIFITCYNKCCTNCIYSTIKMQHHSKTKCRTSATK